MFRNPRIRLVRDEKDAASELQKIGTGPQGVEIMKAKAVYRIIKIDDLDMRAANILKQEILSRGGEAAVSYNAVGFKGKYTDVLLMGTLRHYLELIPRLREQPFGLRKLAGEIQLILKNFDGKPDVMRFRDYTLNLDERTYIMGVLNITPDSFSGDGVWGDVGAAVDYAVKLADEGADIIDVGGESSRPFAEPVSVDEELQRVVPVIKKISRRLTIPISIDTYKPEVAKEAIEAGASMVNDINALRTEGMAEVVSRYDIPVVLMHMKGTPRDMQGNPTYDDVVGEIIAFLKKQAAFALKHDISRDKIILDPGIGFGKTTEHNLEIIRRLREFRSLGFPILIGTSRKSFIGNILDLPPGERLEGTMASVAAGILNGADIVRVHDVRENVRVARMVDCLK